MPTVDDVYNKLVEVNTHLGLWPFKGAIQDVAIYNRALNITEITTHTANGLGMQVT